MLLLSIATILVSRVRHLPQEERLTTSAGVEKVCRVKVDFKNANRKGFETKRKYGFFGKKSWLIDVELQCIFGSKTGGLHFKSLIAGAVSGTATAEFD